MSFALILISPAMAKRSVSFSRTVMSKPFHAQHAAEVIAGTHASKAFSLSPYSASPVVQNENNLSVQAARAKHTKRELSRMDF